MRFVAREEVGIGKAVRQVIGRNIKRIRDRRGMKGSDLSARVTELGLNLSTSGVSEVETASRKLGVDELLILAIALNTSVIDLLTPEDGSPLTVAKGVDPLHPVWLESWLSGDTPWPPKPTNATYTDEYFETASERRKLDHRIGMRPEIQELSVLRSAVAGAIVGPGTWINQIEDPELMAEYLRECLERVNTYVKLLADRIEKNGYGG